MPPGAVSLWEWLQRVSTWPVWSLLCESRQALAPGIRTLTVDETILACNLATLTGCSSRSSLTELCSHPKDLVWFCYCASGLFFFSKCCDWRWLQVDFKSSIKKHLVEKLMADPNLSSTLKNFVSTTLLTKQKVRYQSNIGCCWKLNNKECFEQCLSTKWMFHLCTGKAFLWRFPSCFDLIPGNVVRLNCRTWPYSTQLSHI